MSRSSIRQATVMDICALCRSFPPLPDRPIERPHILAEIDDAFARGVQLVTVEGEDGKGKTTLLAQFALRYPQRTVALFARPTSRHTYDPLYILTDLCEQLHWLMYHEQRRDMQGPPDDGEYRMLLTYLEGRAMRKGQPYYFLVDGLEEIPDEDTAVRDQLLDLVPFGRSHFHFVYAGRDSALDRLTQRSRGTLTGAHCPLTRFSLDEALRYLGDLGVSEGDVQQLLDLTRGLPGYLAVVRRVLQGGVSIQQLMADPPKVLTDLFDYEWAAVKRAAPEDADLLEDLLALLAHDSGHHTLGTLARLTSAPRNQVATLLTPLKFLHVGPHDPASLESSATVTSLETAQRADADEWEVAFVPETFRAYAARRLAARKQWVADRVVADLQSHPLSEAALSQLPTSLAALGRYDDLFRYLSADYFVAVVEHQHALTQALAAASMGMSTAEVTRRDVDLAHLSLIRALLLELGTGGVGREEVEARMALGDEDGALALAQSASLAEDRLDLLATIAKARYLRGGSPSKVIQEQLTQLATQIDPDVLGERADELGLTLLFSLPDVALRFLERASEAEGDKGAATRRPLLDGDLDLPDWLPVAGEMLGVGRAEAREAFDLLQSSLTDPLAKRLAGVASVIYGGRSAEEALEAMGNLRRPGDQLFVLRRWLVRNSAHPDAARIVDEALNRILLSSGEEMPTADAFRDIAVPLPALADREAAARLVGRFDTLADLIERHGPSREYVRLQLLLARTECQYDADKAYNRLFAIWYYATERVDLVERAACLAHLVAALEPIAEAAKAADLRPPIPQKDITEIDAALNECIDALLRTCADQYHATRDVIRALAPRQPERALALARRLNTQARRQAAALDVLRAIITGIKPQTAKRAHAPFEEGLKILSGTIWGDVALVQLAERMAELADPARAPQDDRHHAGRDSGDLATNLEDISAAIAVYLPLWQRCDDIGSADRRARALAQWEVALLQLGHQLADCAGSGTPANGAEGTQATTQAHSESTRRSLSAADLSALAAQIANRLDRTWDEIDPGWRKVTIGFRLVHMLASIDLDRGRAYLQRTEAARDGMQLPTPNAGEPYVACLSLAARAYAGLLDQHSETAADLERLERAIAALPAPGERVDIWADVAVRCSLHNRPEECRRIVVTQIHPLLSQLSDRDAVLQRNTIASAAPALYLAHQETAREWIGRVPRPQRDAIYTQIASVLLTKSPPDDPYDSGMTSGRALTYPEATDICRLIEDIEEDMDLYLVIEQLADCIMAARATGKLSREQQRQIAERLRTIVERRLPDPDNIQHEGYRLIALAQVARIDPMKHTQREPWSILAERARAIPNDSDRGYVVAHLAVTTPSNEDRGQWLEEAEQTIDQLPARLNRIDDYELLARLVLGADWGEGGASRARRYLQKAMGVAAEDPHDRSTYAAQRRLIDLAYQFDEGLARQLATQFDDDPARLAHRLRALEMKKRLASEEGTPSRSDGGSLASASDKLSGEMRSRDRLRALAEACWLQLGALNADRAPAVHIERVREPLTAAACLPLSESFPVYAWALENAVQRFGATAQVHTILRPLFEASVQAAELIPRLVEDATARAQRSARSVRRADVGAAASGDWEPQVIRAGEREKAEQLLRAWCEVHQSLSLQLCDPYFTPEDLTWIRLLSESMPSGCQITVLTGRHAQARAHVEKPWEDTYRYHWRLKVSDQDPPPTEIVILGTERDGKPPFHDRRIIVPGAGVKIGTSLNALGGATESTMTELTPAQAEEIGRMLDEWARGSVWIHRGDKLLRTAFRL